MWSTRLILVAALSWYDIIITGMRTTQFASLAWALSLLSINATVVGIAPVSGKDSKIGRVKQVHDVFTTRSDARLRETFLFLCTWMGASAMWSPT